MRAWDLSARIIARGGKFEMTPDRSGFYVRNTHLTDDEKEWVKANRPEMFAHVLHLCPHPNFQALKRSGALNLEKRKP